MSHGTSAMKIRLFLPYRVTDFKDDGALNSLAWQAKLVLFNHYGPEMAILPGRSVASIINILQL